MIPNKTIEELINKHSELEKDLASGKIDKKSFAEKSKEYSDLNEIIDSAKKYISYENSQIHYTASVSTGSFSLRFFGSKRKEEENAQKQ